MKQMPNWKLLGQRHLFMKLTLFVKKISKLWFFAAQTSIFQEKNRESKKKGIFFIKICFRVAEKYLKKIRKFSKN